MQLTHLHIQNFKGITELDISLLEEDTDTTSPADNAAWVTTARAKRRCCRRLHCAETGDPADTGPTQLLGWPGFLAERVSSQGPTCVELDVRFDPDELETTQALFRQWLEAGSPRSDNSHRRSYRLSQVEARLLRW